jgi:repressor LexA
MSSIGDRFKELRKKFNINQKECASKIGISQGTLSDIESNNTRPSIETLISASRFFNVTTDWLLTGEEHTTNKKTDLILNDLEEECLHMYNQLTLNNKYRILGSLDMLLKTQNTPPPIKKPTKKVPIIGTVAAGSPILATNYFEDFIETDNFKADYALIIKGDSMEPLIKDKEIVLVQKTTVSEGEIGIFIIGTTPEDSEATCKKLKKISNYHIQLISINPRHEPIDIDLTKEQVRAIGKVLI